MSIDAAPAPAALQADALDARAARAWLHTARFLTTASELETLPVLERPEIAFVGRSNAGKSTAINALTQQRRLAFASKTPGRTQHINLFEVGPKDAPDASLADLPGYGYAAVEREAKLRWQKVMADYLVVRRNLEGIVALVDSRHGMGELDLALLDFISPRIAGGTTRLLVLLTKIDKLTRREQAAAFGRTEGVLASRCPPGADIALGSFSATSGAGVDDAAVVLYRWVQGSP